MAKEYINILSILAGAEDQYIDTLLETRAPDPKPTRNRPKTAKMQKCVETARYDRMYVG